MTDGGGVGVVVGVVDQTVVVVIGGVDQVVKVAVCGHCVGGLTRKLRADDRPRGSTGSAYDPAGPQL